MIMSKSTSGQSPKLGYIATGLNEPDFSELPGEVLEHRAGSTYDVKAVAKSYGEGLVHQGIPLGETKTGKFATGSVAAGKVVHDVESTGNSGSELREFSGAYDRRSKAPVLKRGKTIPEADPSMYPFNYVAGSRSGNSFVVGRDDRMSPTEAKLKLAGILEAFGLFSEPHEFCFDFTHALFVAHALNGASVVGPGRANFTVGASAFSYGDIIKFLGSDSRRFFRAYADDIARAVSRVLESYDPADFDSVRMCGQIRSIAIARNLVQYPYLIHDSADACVKLSPAEMSAVLRSRDLVVNNTNNGVESVAVAPSTGKPR